VLRATALPDLPEPTVLDALAELLPAAVARS
jgi:hypothetical protein